VRPAPSARGGSAWRRGPEPPTLGAPAAAAAGCVVDYVRGAASSNPALAWQVE
jgi:hypothetical protein